MLLLLYWLSYWFWFLCQMGWQPCLNCQMLFYSEAFAFILTKVKINKEHYCLGKIKTVYPTGSDFSEALWVELKIVGNFLHNFKLFLIRMGLKSQTMFLKPNLLQENYSSISGSEQGFRAHYCSQALGSRYPKCKDHLDPTHTNKIK